MVTHPAQSSTPACETLSLLNMCLLTSHGSNGENGLASICFSVYFTFSGAVHGNCNMMHTWCAEQIPFSPRHVNRNSLEKRGGATPQSGLADTGKKQRSKQRERERESCSVKAELCFSVQTFDHFALMSSREAFSFYRIPSCMFSLSWNTHRCAACT